MLILPSLLGSNSACQRYPFGRQRLKISDVFLQLRHFFRRRREPLRIRLLRHLFVLWARSTPQLAAGALRDDR